MTDPYGVQLPLKNCDFLKKKNATKHEKLKENFFIIKRLCKRRNDANFLSAY